MEHGSRHSGHRRIERLCLGIVAAAIFAIVVGTTASAAPDRALHGRVTVTKEGSGEGRVVSSPPGIDCGDACTRGFVATDDPANYEPVLLTATAEPGSAFESLAGACSGTSCTIDPVEPGKQYEVVASFVRVRPPQLSLAVSATGSGRVTSSPGGIDCGPTCSASFPTDSLVTLTAAPTPGWLFSGWGGACTGTGPCSVTMSSPRSVTAAFAAPNTVYALAVAAAGGSVTSDVPGISCGESCVGSYGAGVEVTLTPSAYPVTWGGACSGDGACVVPMSQARAVTAAIAGARLSRIPLAVSLTGKGSVTSSPSGISCGSACGALYPLGGAVTLRASAAAGWLFAGWHGSCRGIVATCTVAAKGASAATATFVAAGSRYPVAVTKAGKGAVRSKPAGIDCGGVCSGSFGAGTNMTVEAIPADGWEFVRWSGACTGPKPMCVLGIDGPKSVSATFGRPADQLAPRVTALPSTGVEGQTARLRYRVVEAGGQSRETATVFRGRRRLATIAGPMHAIDPDALFYVLPWQKAVPGELRFCVSSSDPTGNLSKPSCARLRIT